MRRSAGILLPIFSLPSDYGIGSLGQEARAFADFLHAAGQSWWQILPVGPTGEGNSPYTSMTTFAGNPLFIDLELLAADGLLGRLSMQTELPKGLDRAWLMKQDAFCRAADGPVEGILTGLRQGTLLRQIAARGERRAAPRQPERTKDGPGMKK